MTLVKLNNNGLVRNLAHEAFFRNFSDSYVERQENNYNSYELNYKVKEEEIEFVLEIAIPGLAKEDLTIEVDNGTLTIATNEHSEKDQKSGFAATEFSKRFKLSKKVNQDTITAISKNGVLTIILPKNEAAIRKPARAIKIA